MAYRVLARSYRSGTFDEVVGQEPIATTLKNAIRSGRIHHGYLFTGTRGVGKTSMARILARALNCLSADAPTITPCGACASCTAIAEGEDVDVVEIDAASNTGVDNIRELRSNTTLRPARSRFKVYIIDEVHMLSTGAFNALLKTLEEPPPHVKFILATTEAHKVPATIQSRCQRFDFRAIDLGRIAEHLSRIADKEGIKIDDDVLRRIARLANGSMRDALSLLDKLLSYESKHLTAEVVAEIIPPPHDELAADVIAAVAENDAAQALEALDRALQSGRTVDRFCDHLIEHLRTLMLMRTCGADTPLVDVAAAQREALAAQAARFDAPTYVYMIALLEELRRNVRTSGAARALADATVVRLSMAAQFSDIAEMLPLLADADADRSKASTPGEKKNDDKGLTQHGAATRRNPATVPPGAVAPRRSGIEASNRAATVGARGFSSDRRESPRYEGAPPPDRSPDPPTERSTEPLPDDTPQLLAQADREAQDVLPGIAERGAQGLTSDERQRALNDPLVQRIKEVFEGTITSVVRTARRVDESTTVSEESIDTVEHDVDHVDAE